MFAEGPVGVLTRVAMMIAREALGPDAPWPLPLCEPTEEDHHHVDRDDGRLHARA